MVYETEQQQGFSFLFMLINHLHWTGYSMFDLSPEAGSMFGTEVGLSGSPFQWTMSKALIRSFIRICARPSL